MTQAVTLRTAYRFFFPLILMTELNAISKSVIHAFLARSATPSATLAGFNIAFTFYYALTSQTEVSQLLTLSYLKNQRCLPHLLWFFCALVAMPLLIVQLVAFTLVGDWIFGTLFGASEGAVIQAKQATFILSLSAPILLGRALAFGVLMIHKRTIFITISTLIRLVALGVALLILPHYLEGAAAGAAALTTCMLAETVVAWCFAYPLFRSMPATGPIPAYRELWRFSWPLMLNTSTEMGMVFIINVMLGRLVNPDLALAAFGVVHGLVSLLFSPVRNLVQTAQTLVRTTADRMVMTRFAKHLIGGFSAVAILLFWTPLDHWVLHTVMGLTEALEAYCAPAMRFAFAMALFWAFSALFRGLMAGARSTTMLAATGAARMATAGGISVLALVHPELNGAILGLTAWISGYASEVIILWRRFSR
ncbi:MAG: Na+-driven multidrug efflux pump [Gammaproteobacteria bacterium]|jgi:Na+-driven multidrug efflux pump